MRRILLTLLFVASATLLSAQPAIKKNIGSNKPFFFVQISDPQLGFREESGFTEGEALLVETVEAINRLKPAFVVVTGDMVNTSRNKKQIAAYKELIGRVNPKIPVFHIPGNHDIGTYSQEHLDFYLSNYGYERFSFLYGGCAFIGIDSCPIKDNDAEAEAAQYKWLQQELANTSDAKMKFLFLHCPIIIKSPDEKESYSNFSLQMREKYLNLLKQYGVTAVLSGHLHNSSYCSAGGVDLFTTGPSGKPLGSGFSGMAVITVDADGYHYVYSTAADAVAPNRKHSK